MLIAQQFFEKLIVIIYQKEIQFEIACPRITLKPENKYTVVFYSKLILT